MDSEILIRPIAQADVDPLFRAFAGSPVNIGAGVHPLHAADDSVFAHDITRGKILKRGAGKKVKPRIVKRNRVFMIFQL